MGCRSGGRCRDEAVAEPPSAPSNGVLGSQTAERLGVERADGRTILIGDQWFTVIGLLDPIPLYETLDYAVFIGYPIAAELFDTPLNPSAVYVTTDPASISASLCSLVASGSPM